MKPVNQLEPLEGQLNVTYDLYRTALLNRKYYGDRLAAYQRWNTLVELIVALGTSTAIGGLAFLESGVGKSVLAIVGGLAVVLAVVKTALQLSQQIERYSKLYTNHSILYSELDNLVSRIRVQQTVTNETMTSFFDIHHRFNLLASEDDPHPSRRLAEKYYKEVDKEIPSESLWLPRRLSAEDTYVSGS
jgi:hypothetical protein